LNSAQVRGKARVAVKRREEEIHQDEIEGGELNLVPYLDIVTNLMLFLLAISSVVALGQIDTMLPNVRKAAQKPAVAATDKEPSLQLVVSILPQQLILWSLSELEGTIKEPKALVPRLGGDTSALSYDYAKLNAAVHEIAARRWRGKVRPAKTYEVILQADDNVPYETVVAVMDNLRRRLPDDGEAKKPIEDADLELTKDGVWVPREKPIAYDPDTMWLFNDVLFADSTFD